MECASRTCGPARQRTGTQPGNQNPTNTRSGTGGVGCRAARPHRGAARPPAGAARLQEYNKSHGFHPERGRGATPRTHTKNITVSTKGALGRGRDASPRTQKCSWSELTKTCLRRLRPIVALVYFFLRKSAWKFLKREGLVSLLINFMQMCKF